MTVTNTSPASAAFGVRLRFVLRLIKDSHKPQNRARPVTLPVRYAVTKLREATRGLVH